MESSVLSRKFNLFDYHSTLTHAGQQDEHILVFYKGPFSNAVLAEISQSLRDILATDPRLSKKLFAIFIELAQNIAYYSSERNHIRGRQDSPGIGTMLIKELPTHFMLLTGNTIKNEDTFKLVDKCEAINALNRDELRKYKRIERNRPHSSNDGANNGLIQVALTANSPLQIEINTIDNMYSFFSLFINLDKEQPEHFNL